MEKATKQCLQLLESFHSLLDGKEYEDTLLVSKGIAKENCFSFINYILGSGHPIQGHRRTSKAGRMSHRGHASVCQADPDMPEISGIGKGVPRSSRVLQTADPVLSNGIIAASGNLSQCS